MAKKRISKSEMSKLLAKDLTKLTRKSILGLHRAIPLKAPKTESAPTSRGKVAKADVLKIREQVIREWESNRLNFRP